MYYILYWYHTSNLSIPILPYGMNTLLVFEKISTPIPFVILTKNVLDLKKVKLEKKVIRSMQSYYSTCVEEES